MYMLLRILYYAQKMAKNLFVFLLFFTLAKVWQENENDFSEKPINWSDLPKLLCW